MRESRAWQYLKGNIPPWLAMERVEPMYPPGLPDCFWSLKSVNPSKARPPMTHGPVLCGWLELKYCEADDPEFKAGRIPKLRAEQPLFLRRQAANGVPGGILLRVGDTSWLFWKAQPHHDWCGLVNSRNAVDQAMDVSGDFLRYSAPVPLNFDLLFRLLVTPWRLDT